MENNIELTVIGCGDAFSSGGQLNSCFYIKAPKHTLLLDCGASSMLGLKRNGIDIDTIDSVLISHFHGDHYGGLPFLLLEASVRRREKPLTIISPPTGKERITQLLELLYPRSDVLGKLQVVFKTFVPNGILQADHLEVTALPVIHKEETFPHGMRIGIGGKVIAYSGDTEWTPLLIELARGADLFICECNFYDAVVEGHMNYQTLLSYDAQLTYKQIRLTHFGEEMLRNLDKVGHPYAEDGEKIIL